MEVIASQTKDIHEGVTRFTHHKHREVLVILLIRLDHKLQNGVERILVLFAGNSSVAVTWDVNSIDFFQKGKDILVLFLEIDGDDDNA